MDKQSIWKIVADIVIIGIALTLGIMLRSKLAQQPIVPVQPQSPNWFIAIPFMLGMLFLIVMGYLTERKVNK
jgi:hypothetical protein